MYISSWKQKEIYNRIPILKNENSCYLYEKIDNPTFLDYWNFFINNNMITYLIKLSKEIPSTQLFCLDSYDNAIETALSFSSVTLLKNILKTSSIHQFLRIDEFDENIFDKIFKQKITIVHELLLFIKQNKIEHNFTSKHMFNLLNENVTKAILFEKIFPNLFLNLYSGRIDEIPEELKFYVLKHNELKKKLYSKLNKRNTKQIVLKI